ncbi:MAG: tyrosine-type recombinase/integrase [Streptosporangiaceae bacterium]
MRRIWPARPTGRRAGGSPGRRRARTARLVGPHTLRHAFITAALDAGLPLRDVQEAASHADLRTTMRQSGSGHPWADTPRTPPPTSPGPPGSRHGSTEAPSRHGSPGGKPARRHARPFTQS